MAKPRVFVSSTYYDLKHIRASLDAFIESLGFETILSEKGSIAYTPESALDASCYREAALADIFVLIVGGRYGSESSDGNAKADGDFFTRYESVTKREFEEASEKNIPTYILVEQGVYSEYRTYLRNRESTSIEYAHVDSVNIFRFIEQILGLPRNNPVFAFDKFSQAEAWLREQWAGLFQELLRRSSEQRQLSDLASQVEGLREINATLQTYLESVVSAVSPSESQDLIEREKKRLEEARRDELLRRNGFYTWLVKQFPLSEDRVLNAFRTASDTEGLYRGLIEAFPRPASDFQRRALHRVLLDSKAAVDDVDDLREMLGLPPFPAWE